MCRNMNCEVRNAYNNAYNHNNSSKYNVKESHIHMIKSYMCCVNHVKYK